MNSNYKQITVPEAIQTNTNKAKTLIDFRTNIKEQVQKNKVFLPKDRFQPNVLLFLKHLKHNKVKHLTIKDLYLKHRKFQHSKIKIYKLHQKVLNGKQIN